MAATMKVVCNARPAVATRTTKVRVDMLDQSSRMLCTIFRGWLQLRVTRGVDLVAQIACRGVSRIFSHYTLLDVLPFR